MSSCSSSDLGVLAEVRSSQERIEEFLGVQIVRVDGVVGPRVGDEPGGVEVFRDTHRPLGGVAETARRADELRRVERRGRVVGPRPARDALDYRLRGPRERLVRCLGRLLVPDALGFVAVFVAIEVLRFERLVVLLQVGEQFPVVFGVERLNLAFAVDDEFQRRTLHPPDADEVVAELARRKREEARQRGPPDEVDYLAGFARGRQIEVEFVGVLERLGDLVFRDGGEAHAVDGDVLVHFADEFLRFLPDEFALAVVVGRDGRRGSPSARADEAFERCSPWSVASRR